MNFITMKVTVVAQVTSMNAILSLCFDAHNYNDSEKWESDKTSHNLKLVGKSTRQ